MASSEQPADKGPRFGEIRATDIIRAIHALRHHEFTKHGLTRQEMRIATRLMDGHDNASIATSLYLSLSAVKYHIRKLYQKTGAKNKAEFNRIIRCGMDDSRLCWTLEEIERGPEGKRSLS